MAYRSCLYWASAGAYADASWNIGGSAGSADLCSGGNNPPREGDAFLGTICRWGETLHRLMGQAAGTSAPALRPAAGAVSRYLRALPGSADANG